MEIEENQVIIFDDNTKFIIHSKTNLDNINYYLAMGVTDDEESLTSDVAMFKEFKKDKDIYLDRVLDPDLITKLHEIFEKDLDE